MAAKCCGGEWDFFLRSHIHKTGCPERQIGGINRETAEKQLEQGRKDAFRSSSSSDSSYQLGKKLEEERQVEHIVNNVFGFPIGGRRRR